MTSPAEDPYAEVVRAAWLLVRPSVERRIRTIETAAASAKHDAATTRTCLYIFPPYRLAYVRGGRTRLEADHRPHGHRVESQLVVNMERQREQSRTRAEGQDIRAAPLTREYDECGPAKHASTSHRTSPAAAGCKTNMDQYMMRRGAPGRTRVSTMPQPTDLMPHFSSKSSQCPQHALMIHNPFRRSIL